MPNWCENQLTVQVGSSLDDKQQKEALKQMKEFNKIALSNNENNEDEDSSYVNGLFNKFIPEPPEMKDIHSGACTIDGKQHRVWREVDGKNIPLTDEDELMAKYGATNLYDWHCQNYGCKWDTGAYMSDCDDEYSRFEFETPWSPPIQFLEHLAARFPLLHISCKYEEEGMGFMGCAKGQGFIDDNCVDTY